MNLPAFPVDDEDKIHVPDGWEKLPRVEFVARMLASAFPSIEREAEANVEGFNHPLVSRVAAHVLAYADIWESLQIEQMWGGQR